MGDVKYYISDRHRILEEQLKKGKVDRFNLWRVLIQELKNDPEKFEMTYRNTLKGGKFIRGSKLKRDESKLLFLLRNLYLSANNGLLIHAISGDRKVQEPLYQIIAKEFIEKGRAFLRDYKKENSKFLKDYYKTYGAKYYKTIPRFFRDRYWGWERNVRDETYSGGGLDDISSYYLEPFIKEVEKDLKI